MSRDEEQRQAGTPEDGAPEEAPPEAGGTPVDEQAGTAEIAPDSELAEALREKDQFRALLQRTQADFVNFRNRVQAEQDELRRKTRASLLAKVLEVVDSIDAALAGEATAGVDKKFIEGVAGIRRSFETFLTGEGVEKFDSVGERFDPRRHEALVRTETGDYDPDTVIGVMRPGYLIKDEVLRPALVEVAAPVAGESDGEQTFAVDR